MKKTFVLFFLVIGLITVKNVEAQMPTAKKVVWDVQISTDVNASKGDVWRILTDNEKLPNYSNAHVKSIKIIDEEPVVSRVITFANGDKRFESIRQTDYVNKFMVISINKESLPQGVKNAEIAIFTKTIDDDHTNILWVARIEGKKLQKQKLMQELKVEFSSYLNGFQTIKD